MEEATKTEIVHKVEHVEKDALRFGLSGVKGDVVDSHPLQSHLRHSSAKKEAEMKQVLLAATYGSACPLRMQLDAQILSRCQRLPGALPSSMLGLEAMTGSLDGFGFEDYLNDPSECEDYKPRNMHHGMEVRLGLSRGPLWEKSFSILEAASVWATSQNVSLTELAASNICHRGRIVLDEPTELAPQEVIPSAQREASSSI